MLQGIIFSIVELIDYVFVNMSRANVLSRSIGYCTMRPLDRMELCSLSIPPTTPISTAIMPKIPMLPICQALL
jgi:hypothetical protein